MLHPHTSLDVCVQTTTDNGVTWKTLDEFKPDIQAKEAMCYIEAKDGQRFRLICTNTRPQYTRPPGSSTEEWSASYYADGRLALCVMYAPATKPTSECQGFATDASSTETFAFRNLSTTGDEHGVRDESSTKDLGELRVEIWRMRRTGPNKPWSSHIAPPTNIMYSEKVMKKSGHTVGAGDKVQVPMRTGASAVRTESTPMVQFRFKYRSAVLLDLNGIRPLPEEDSDVEEENAHAGPTPAEMPAPIVPIAGPSQGAPAHSGTLGTSVQPAVKKEGDKKGRNKRDIKPVIIDIDDGDDDEVKLVREANPRKKRVKVEAVNGIIDLSND